MTCVRTFPLPMLLNVCMYTHIIQVGMLSTRTQTHVTIVATLCASEGHKVATIRGTPSLHGLPKWVRQDRLGSPALHFRGATLLLLHSLRSLVSSTPVPGPVCHQVCQLSRTFWSEEISSAPNLDRFPASLESKWVGETDYVEACFEGLQF